MLINNLYKLKSKRKKSIDDPDVSKKEAHFRSIIKSISWRIIGTLDTVAISWFITGKLDLALAIGSIEVVSKMILYYFHERIWNIVKWGRK